MAVTTVTLSNGVKVPALGLGTWQGGDDPSNVEQAVRDAVDAGYRHFDCAYIYGNEKNIGKALREKIEAGVVKREDLFITTKLWNTSHKKEQVVPACKKSVENLGLDYVDLYLIHWPCAFPENATDFWPVDEKGKPLDANVDYVDTWRGMEECVRLNYTKSIGLSNFNSQQIDRVLSIAQIKPVMNQVECHVCLNQHKLREFCAKRGITVTAYSPFGAPYRSKSNEFAGKTFDLKHPTLARLAEKYGKTPGQIILRFLVELGTIPIPKSSSKERIKENINIFDFKLSAEDTKILSEFNCEGRVIHSEEWKAFKHYPFNIEF